MTIGYFNINVDAHWEIQPIGLDKLFAEAGKKIRVILITALMMGTLLLMLVPSCSSLYLFQGEIVKAVTFDLGAFCIQLLQL